MATLKQQLHKSATHKPCINPACPECTTNAKPNIHDDDHLTRAFVDWCDYRHLDPAETVKILHAQDWRQEEPVTMQAVTIHEDCL
jgi:hypothetical protein